MPNTHTQSCNHHHNHDAKHAHYPTSPLLLTALPTTDLFFCRYSFALGRISYKWDPTVCSLLCLASLSLLWGSSMLLPLSVNCMFIVFLPPDQVSVRAELCLGHLCVFSSQHSTSTHWPSVDVFLNGTEWNVLGETT